MRLIDADDLWSEIMALPHNGDMISSEEVEQEIRDAPTVDAAEVVHGRWEYHDPVSPNCFCSVCDYDAPWDIYGDYHSERTNYCPNCGAKMDGGE